MQELINTIENLNKLNPNWKESLINGHFQNMPYNDEASTQLNLLVQIIKSNKEQFIDTSDESAEKEWESQIIELLGADVYQKLLENISSILDIYSAMKVVRTLGESTSAFLSDAIYYLSLPYKDSFMNFGQAQERYGIADAALLQRALNSLDTIIYTHVNSRFSKNNAKREFEYVTGIPEPYSSYYAELYGNYFEKFQKEYIVDRLNRLENKIDYLMNLLNTKDAT